MSDSFTALREGTRQILHEQKDSMREIVSGLSSEALNWRPAEHADTNSIAQMLSHALEAERFLVSASVDATVDRNREAQFQVAGVTADDMVALIDRTEQEVDRFLDQMTSDHLAQDIARPGRTRTGTWWLLHAVEHSREHVGQALLTRQLYESQASE